MNIVIWSKTNCPQCEQAKLYVKSKELTYEERLLGDEWTVEQLREVVPNAKSVPQVFIDDEYVGGLKELKQRI